MEYNPFTLAGKSILVTGASAGIGRATAIECSRMGARVYIVGRSAERLAETIAAMAGEGHEAIALDLAAEGAVTELVARLPALDGVVNNAGITDVLPVPFITAERWERLRSIDLDVPIMLVAQLMAARKINKGGAIVNMSSVSGERVAYSGGAMYAAAKGALSSFTRAAALELAKRNIRVNNLCPGMIDTGIFGEKISAETLAEDAKTYPLKRYGRPEEVARAAVYLLSDAASFVTGASLVIDGGYTIQ